MNEWGLVDQESMAALRNSAIINKFKQSCGFEHSDGIVLSNPHSSVTSQYSSGNYPRKNAPTITNDEKTL